MDYISTRNKNLKVSSAFAIANGISTEGGLFVPEEIPALKAEDFEALKKLDYIGRAKAVLSKFLTDFTDDELDFSLNGAYKNTFDDDCPAPMAKLGDKTHILELWHGPTCAFKDLALQLLPYLMTVSAKKVSDGIKTVILVATSGDTGKAALEGFKDVENTEIIVFYPEDGVSAMQKLQMVSQKGSNVHVCAIRGNFDDAQSAVKKIFTDEGIIEKLKEKNMKFSSANSINWGRLAPQIVYYVSAYIDLLNEKADLSRGFNVTVPTGNFGNILAAYYAKKMGVPINKLICASNSNNVLTDFINSGIYDRNRKFFTTCSPSMDILISSNLERLLFDLCGNDDEYVASLQKSLAESGKYEVCDAVREKLDRLFFADFCTDKETFETISSVFKEYGYLIDTHTAVAVNVYKKYLNKTNDNIPAVIASTASPYKFTRSVLSALGEKAKENEFENIELLKAVSNTQIPSPIENLKNAEVRFKEVYNKDELDKAVYDSLM